MIQKPTREQELEALLRSILTVAKTYGEHLIPTPLAAVLYVAEQKLKEPK